MFIKIKSTFIHTAHFMHKKAPQCAFHLKLEWFYTFIQTHRNSHTKFEKNTIVLIPFLKLNFLINKWKQCGFSFIKQKTSSQFWKLCKIPCSGNFIYLYTLLSDIIISISFSEFHLLSFNIWVSSKAPLLWAKTLFDIMIQPKDQALNSSKNTWDLHNANLSVFYLLNENF